VGEVLVSGLYDILSDVQNICRRSMNVNKVYMSELSPGSNGCLDMPKCPLRENENQAPAISRLETRLLSRRSQCNRPNRGPRRCAAATLNELSTC
jgi:hypothetical protein